MNKKLSILGLSYASMTACASIEESYGLTPEDSSVTQEAVHPHSTEENIDLILNRTQVGLILQNVVASALVTVAAETTEQPMVRGAGHGKNPQGNDQAWMQPFSGVQWYEELFLNEQTTQQPFVSPHINLNSELTQREDKNLIFITQFILNSSHSPIPDESSKKV